MRAWRQVKDQGVDAVLALARDISYLTDISVIAADAQVQLERACREHRLVEQHESWRVVVCSQYKDLPAL